MLAPVYPEDGQVKNGREKSQICFPEGEEAGWSSAWGNVIGGGEKVRQVVLCAGISELHAFSRDAR